jgi:outer membrane lipoprotein carrier protein
MKFNGLTPFIYLCGALGLSIQGVQATPLEAQNANLASNIETKTESSAKSELRQLIAKFQSLQANFSQEIADMQGELLQETEGSILLQKPNMLRWEVKSPDESLLIADGQTVYNIDPFVEQLTLMEQESLTASNPLMLLISDDEEQWANVNIEKLDGDFIIKPQNTDAQISMLILSFNKDKQLSLLTSIDQQQQRNVISFSDIEYNVTMPASVFSYKPNANWVIDDQRAKN